MNVVLKFIVTIVALNAFATAAYFEVNTPGVNAIKQSMQTRHAQLAAHYGGRRGGP